MAHGRVRVAQRVACSPSAGTVGVPPTPHRIILPGAETGVRHRSESSRLVQLIRSSTIQTLLTDATDHAPLYPPSVAVSEETIGTVEGVGGGTLTRRLRSGGEQAPFARPLSAPKAPARNSTLHNEPRARARGFGCAKRAGRVASNAPAGWHWRLVRQCGGAARSVPAPLGCWSRDRRCAPARPRRPRRSRVRTR